STGPGLRRFFPAQSISGHALRDRLSLVNSDALSSGRLGSLPPRAFVNDAALADRGDPKNCCCRQLELANMRQVVPVGLALVILHRSHARLCNALVGASGLEPGTR